MNDPRRITLVARRPNGAPRPWVAGPHAPSRVIFVNALTVLTYALDHGIHDLHQDVERVIIDRMDSATDYLDLLAALPLDFVGDVLFVQSDGSGFLSAFGARGNRLLYRLTTYDVEFYLQTNGLVAVPQQYQVATEQRAAQAA